jgi:hypothetical protein
MSTRQCYRIFQKLPLKQPTFVETVTDLGEAKERWKELNQTFPADYFILDCEHSIFFIPFDGALANKAEFVDVRIFTRSKG